MKPLIELADFQHLDLRVGTVVELRPFGSSLDLVAAEVQVFEERVAAVLPASEAARLSPGARVVVATALHRLAAGGATFTAFLVAALAPDIQVADGSLVA
jgi:flagellar biosynthesis/type III secretory pathway ATPase